MYSTTNHPTAYRMVPRAMLGDLKPTPFRQWIQLERYAGKRDYVTATTADLAEVWGGVSVQAARTGLRTLSGAGWVVQDGNGLPTGTHRLWIPWFQVTDPDDFLITADDYTRQRMNGGRLEDERTRSFREAAMTAKGTEYPYVHVPVAVVDQAATDTDLLVWTAMRSYLGPEGISTSAATIGKRAGITRRPTIATATKRLVESGLLLPTGTTGRKGVQGYTVPEHLAGTYRVRKSLPSVPMAAAA
ncbi:hypothetical protein Sipo8835_29235 [Streptomyces ipomoeae]|uniref:Uncharacterized protein n=1 Tax=Streptomyces ipomoeae TaxID=103232 RepID=A0AAE8VY25_9ACTN|nr:hypothetical protein [Streptomyces ipomoeae]TQE26413.1 hypothetical protein Sipo8835_29235 [Streptomyces ipomoeae]